MASNAKKLVYVDLSEGLKQANIVNEYFYNLEDYAISLVLENHYEGTVITSKMKLSEWSKSLHDFKKELRTKGVIDEHLNLICDTLWDNYDRLQSCINSKLTADAKSIAKLTRERETQQTRPKAYLRKYTGNGTIPLHESAIIQGQPVTFLSLTESGKFQYVPYLEGEVKTYYPKDDTVDTLNPLPYIFESTDELNRYLELAKATNLEQLFTLVDSVFRKYVNLEDHYTAILVADIIYSYFFDKFSTTHYNIFTGDNGSGKNSALLVFKWLAYRFTD
jgi:hypothetical protein